ncbi:glycosyltransferase family 8 protein [Salmonella enterica subsp. enterica]|nr:glycosyltransferase family 8 protein [Salmonella enterica subsp. enterica]
MSDIKSYISNQKNIIQHDDFFGRRLDIALCFDHGFIMPAGVAIYSIIENNKDIDLHFHLLISGVSEYDLLPFLELKQPNVSITAYHINNNFDINPETLILGIPLSTCLRFLIPDVVNKGISKILYLDCDIICHGSLSELIDINLEGEIAGVMLINNDEWRKNNVTQESLSMINSGKIFRYADQDVLNILLNGKVKYLQRKFNNKTTLSVNFDAEAKNIDNTIIMHYVTPNKPWYKIFKARYFERYFNASPWKNNRRFFAPSPSEIRLKAKREISGKNYSIGVYHYFCYLISKVFRLRF